MKISGKIIIQILTLLFLMTGVISLQKLYINQINSQATGDYFKEEKELKTLVEIQKKMPSFGFDNLIADWNFLQFIQYFGDTPGRNKTGSSLISDYFEVVVKRDPRFVEALMILSPANSIYGGKPEKTVVFMDEALKHITPEIHPYASLIWSYKAVDELLFLGDGKAAQHSYEMAAAWALQRGDEIGKEMADRNLETARFLADNPDSKKAQISSWALILSNAPDEQTRQRAIEEIRSLGGDILVTPSGGLQIKMPEDD
ncbi:MAG: hypothetical protein DSM107014_08275 [Gomphosphaeria aponina SAG 52.96 = DSM 107014]|uniref:Uncharacterized protein n=1 Tax=Gomphosphaeria aponina SAG 52.96 = DSM 107014 TaxID=1521640 RepID=A0A941GV88_9CHRO|nr:hypothetical protein [Gomphosphaeria aponina SAG 52.96 = DSM 107014]